MSRPDRAGRLARAPNTGSKMQENRCDNAEGKGGTAHLDHLALLYGESNTPSYGFDLTSGYLACEETPRPTGLPSPSTLLVSVSGSALSRLVSRVGILETLFHIRHVVFNPCILCSDSLVRISPWAAIRPFCLTSYLVLLPPVISTSPVSDTFGNPPSPWSARFLTIT
jgi:hypothetical protein